METIYRISKTYVGYKNHDVRCYETNLTREQAIRSLDLTERSLRRYGGTIVERTEDSLTVEESNGSKIIIFSIYEQTKR